MQPEKVIEAKLLCMSRLGRLVLAAVLLAMTTEPTHARKKPHPPKKPVIEQKANPADIEAATRLQIFLDRANFSPGKIDGHYDDFTLKALALYRQSRGEPPPPPSQPGTPPDTSGLDLSSVAPVFTAYNVTQADLQTVGRLPNSVREQAKLKFLPYRTGAEAIAEKFHCDLHFLEQLNPGRTSQIKAGDKLVVPNVEPFEIAAVKNLTPGSEITPPVANDMSDNSNAENAQPETTAPSPITTSIRIDTKTEMLGVFEGEKLIAAYPVTVGSAELPSPVGEWKVRGVAKLPRFRYDKQMLRHGRRSGNFHLLPPGPNSPVGVIWIALNKKGIGLHGTNEPDTIGQSASHGCIRLTNWDVVHLAQKVKAGVPVSIH
jgi:lipoprotein-anchoring transpeptidase ErfK/SrfK